MEILSKKVKLLGKSVPVLVLVIMALGVVSAAVVTYISNTTRVEIAVEQPMQLLISADGESYSVNPLTFMGIYGGDSTEFFLRAKNRANVPITGLFITTELIDVTNNNASCDDLAEVEVVTPDETILLSANPGACTNEASGLGQKAVIKIPAQYLALEEEDYNVTVTFSTAIVPTTYAILSKVTTE